MATTTSKMGLTLPGVNDAADISVLNNNFQKLDYLGGYGLGASAVQIDDWNTAIENGFYRSSASCINTPTAGSQYHGMMINYSSVLGNQFVFKTWATGSEMWTRRYYNGAFEPWECLNPAMTLGVEYRTTERFNGSPVYAKAVSCGKGPSGGAVNLPTGLSGNVTFVEANCKAVSDAGWGVFLNQYLSFGEKGSGTATLSIIGAGDLSTRNIYLTVKYIKE